MAFIAARRQFHQLLLRDGKKRNPFRGLSADSPILCRTLAFRSPFIEFTFMLPPVTKLQTAEAAPEDILTIIYLYCGVKRYPIVQDQ